MKKLGVITVLSLAERLEAHGLVKVIRLGGVCVGYRPAVGIDIGTKTQCQYDIEYCA